jgi:hypothetical protein
MLTRFTQKIAVVGVARHVDFRTVSEP